MRYSKTKALVKKGKQQRGTPIYPKIEENDADIYVISQYGDRLDTIAFDFYGDPHLWWVIAKANGLNDLNIKQGSSLRIPVMRESIKVR